MARKARHRISYVLPLGHSVGGHRLGVNGLAVDSENSVLYSGGRDGAICAWDLNLDLVNSPIPDYDEKLPKATPTVFRQQIQAHTHWINDIALAQSNQALISASSDITVKIWRPSANDGLPPQTIGLHSDYVKTLAVPNPTSDWVASGGLDRKIFAWDLNGGGQRLCIDVSEDESGSMSSKEKGSVYALAATNNVIASGGPESTVRVWDARTGKRITKLVGHTDNIRDVLVSQDGSTIMTASSDQTVKVWSTVAGRCMYTLTMHDSSVWSLYSPHPDLSVFYSSDRNGVVAKTDTRDVIELDEGISVAVCQEHEGVHQVVAAGDNVWTATSKPSINRWRDVNTEQAEIDVPENYSTHRHRSSIASATTKLRYPSPPNRESSQSPPPATNAPTRKIPLKHILRLSNTVDFPTPLVQDVEKTPEADGTQAAENLQLVTMQPVRLHPDYSIEGQTGLIKHVMLNDRKRVLTQDTAGDVVMWDLLKCVPVKSFGKRDIDDVKDEVTTSTVTVANWCTVNTRTGSVAVILEENTCFDAEMYADELDLDDDIEFRDDQRINLGKWVLRYLFSNLITEEIRRDQRYRKALLQSREQLTMQRENAPAAIDIPQSQFNGFHQGSSSPLTGATPRASASIPIPNTPGLTIGLATPGSYGSPGKAWGHLSTSVEGGPVQAPTSQPIDASNDYFSPTSPTQPELASPGGNKPPVTPGEAGTDEPATPGDGSKDTPAKGLFGKKFRMGMSFSGMTKIGRPQNNEKDKPIAVEEKHEDESDSRSSKTSNSRVVDDNLYGTIQKIRFGYDDLIQQQAASQQAYQNGLPVPPVQALEVTSGITPSLPAETPVLKPPLNTTILIQEDRPEAGGVADLFEGTVGALGEMCDLVEKTAPMWLGDVLLKNQVPVKDIVKISFILEPFENQLASIAADGNNRLNANRMLRARKILAYVAERIEPAPAPLANGEPDPNAMRPEEYLELYCQNQLVPPTMSLATIRSHLWRGGGDIVLFYKANGRKPILHQPSVKASNLPFKTGVQSLVSAPTDAGAVQGETAL
ncbi:Hypothetical protein R9X50_00741400 [Acrodontium crateriforme]|uniref:Uncharacterized protein n=1 Tax=Acrodontium crateriforme TaxID=150365 RepID=A0AAQ3MBF9_9PEZI|nr:Hypothetical protein R9X50_00741400 [Acrodontium crateriforme]